MVQLTVVLSTAALWWHHEASAGHNAAGTGLDTNRFPVSTSAIVIAAFDGKEAFSSSSLAITKSLLTSRYL